MRRGVGGKLRTQHTQLADPGCRVKDLGAPSFLSLCPRARSELMLLLNKVKHCKPKAKCNRSTSCEHTADRLDLGPKPLYSIIYGNSRKYVLTNKNLMREKISRSKQDLSLLSRVQIFYNVFSPFKVQIWSELTTFVFTQNKQN